MTRSKIRTSGAEGLTLSSTSLTVANGLTLTDGDIAVASGHGISFAADSSASGMASELFHDYEEGTYTGVITDGGSGGTVTLNGDNTFHYNKIGRIVYVMGNANRNDSTGYTNNLQLSLPFTTSSTQNMNAPNGGVWLDGTGTDKVALVYIPNNQNYVLFKESGDSSDYITTDNFQTGRPLYASFWYYTNT